MGARDPIVRRAERVLDRRLVRRLSVSVGVAKHTAGSRHAGRITYRRSGFTLLELLVALALTGAVALLAHRVFVGVADGTLRLAQARRALDREMNARRVLDQLAGSIELGTKGTLGFQGEPDRVAFTTWYMGAGGWLERRSVVITRRGTQLTAAWLDAEPLVLREGVAGLAVDYLLEPGEREEWLPAWRSSVSAPLAMRLRVAGCGRGDAECVDTLLLVVGPRG